MTNTTTRGQEIRRRQLVTNQNALRQSYKTVAVARPTSVQMFKLTKIGNLSKKVSTTMPLPSILLAGLAFSVIVYLYMVVSIIFATVERKHFEELVREYTTELSYNETIYGQKMGEVTLASAQQIGFISAESAFAKKADASVLTLNR